MKDKRFDPMHGHQVSHPVVDFNVQQVVLGGALHFRKQRRYLRLQRGVEVTTAEERFIGRRIHGRSSSADSAKRTTGIRRITSWTSRPAWVVWQSAASRAAGQR